MDTVNAPISCKDGRELPATLHLPAEPAAAAVIAPGLGIPRRFYDAFAAYLAEQGIAALTFDYRGVSEAQGPDEADRSIRFEDWGRLDMDAALSWAQDRFPRLPLFHIGHSAGGNLVGLAEASERLAGLVLVAANAPNGGHWQGRARLGIWVLWHLLAPALAFGRTRVPLRRLGLSSVDVPAGVIRQWARWGRSERYLFNPAHRLDTSRYRRLSVPALVLEFTDDTAFAPPPAVDALLAEMPRLAVDRRRLAPSDAGDRPIGHLGFFRPAMRDTLWPVAARWILDAVSLDPSLAKRKTQR